MSQHKVVFIMEHYQRSPGSKSCWRPDSWPYKAMCGASKTCLGSIWSWSGLGLDLVLTAQVLVLSQYTLVLVLTWSQPFEVLVLVLVLVLNGSQIINILNLAHSGLGLDLVSTHQGIGFSLDLVSILQSLDLVLVLTCSQLLKVLVLSQ